MKKVIKFLNDNYKILVPTIILFSLLISIFIYLYYDKYKRYESQEQTPAYRYATLNKEEFDLTIIKNRNNEIKRLETSSNYDLETFSYPIYTATTIIFPQKMAAVYMVNDLFQYQIPKNSYLTISTPIKLTTANYIGELNHYFLHDGKNLYFFLEPTTLTIGTDQIELSAYSFLIANYNNNLSYYNQSTDEFTYIETNDNNIIASNNYYKINVMQDKIDYHQNEIFLGTIENLQLINQKEE